MLVLSAIGTLLIGFQLVALILLPLGSLLLGVGLVSEWFRDDWRRLSNIEELVATTHSIIITTDRDGLINGFNPAAERCLGYSAADVLGKLTPEAFHPRGDSGDTPELIYSRKTAVNVEQDWVYVRRDGTTFPAIVTVGSIRDEAGQDILHYGIGLDISLRKAGEDAQFEQQELIESIARTSPTIFYIFDLVERRIVYTNRQLASTLGYTDAQIAHMGPDPLPCLMHPEDLDILFNRYHSCTQLLDGEVMELEFRCLTSQGDLRWLQARDVVFRRDAEGNPTQILVNVVDTTEKKLLDEQIESQVMEIQDTNLALEIQTSALEEANSQLEALAFTDGLTGIANHRSFQEELAKTFDLAKRRKHRLSLMLIDVDQFKQYNDTYGHPSGDIVLKRVATVIRDACPPECLPARYGGEEFAVVCPGFTTDGVLALAETIRAAIESTPWPDRHVTVSIGAVTMSPDCTSPSELVNASDNALYSSKASGRNCVTFYSLDKRRLAS